MVAPALKKEIVLSVEAEVTGHPFDSAERKWTLRGGIEVLLYLVVVFLHLDNQRDISHISDIELIFFWWGMGVGEGVIMKYIDGVMIK